MKNYLRKEDRNRFVERGQRMSSAHNPFGGNAPVSVSFVSNPGFNFKEASKNARRVTNLQLLKKHVFDDSIAKMASRAEIAPDRLSALLDLELALSSELAEHLEKALGLPGGWLDIKRDDWSEEDTRDVTEQMHRAEKEQEEAEAEHQPRIFLVRPEEKKEETAQADSRIEVEQTTTTSAPAQGETSYVNKESKMGAVPADLEWLNSQLDAMPRGSKSKLAKLMNRSVNDLSAWFKGHRAMPASARPPLIAALQQFDPALAAQFIEKTRAEGFGKDVEAAAKILSKVEAPVAVEDKAVELEETQAAAEALKAEVKQEAPAKPVAGSASTVVKSRAGSSTYISFRKPSARSAEINEMAMRTAQTLAEVVNSVMRLQEMAAKAEVGADD